MKRSLRAALVLALAALSPALVHAGNREIAQQIGGTMRDSGQLANYNINVKYSNGTAWLAGRVTSQQQMAAAVAIAEQCPDVSKVVNQLAIAPADAAGKAPGTSFLDKLKAGNAVKKASASAPAHDFGPELMAQAAKPMARRPQRPPVPHMNMQMQMQMQAMQQHQQRPIRRVDHVVSQQCVDGYPGGMGPGGMGMNGMGGMSGMAGAGRPLPAYVQGAPGGAAPMMTDNPNMPNYAWPAYASYPNYAALTYPKQYSATAWPYIGPFYPYPQVPLGWRKVTLEWDDGWWFLDFKDDPSNCWEP